MKELHKNNELEIIISDSEKIVGEVVDYTDDRILVKIFKNSIEKAAKLNELDDFEVCVKTVFGQKRMYSCLISKLNSKNMVVIENTEAISVKCLRNNVRITCDFDFVIKINNSILTAKALNISAGGLAFKVDKTSFKIDDIIDIVLPSELFGRLIETKLKILKCQTNRNCAGSFEGLRVYDEDRIVKFVFSKMTDKNK